VVLGSVLAIAASVGYGVSDVLSGSAVRRYSTASVALWSQLVGLALLAVAALVLRPAVSWPALGWGVGAGALGAVALLLFYTALQRGPTAVVTPVAGSGVVIPVVAGLLGGESVGWRAGAGVAVVVVGVLVVAATGGGDGPDHSGAAEGPRRRLVRAATAPARPVPAHDGCVPEDGDGATRSAVVLAAAAALGFGAFFVVLDAATGSGAGGGGGGDGGPFDAAVAVALAVQVGALLVTGLVATRHSRACLAPRPGLLAVAGSVGLVDVAADLVLVLAVGTGPLAVVGPLASLDPVVAVLIATAVLGERLRVAQVLGVAGVLAGVVLVAIG
jgi:drug/metabolite transporter (DMT)-like permease